MAIETRNVWQALDGRHSFPHSTAELQPTWMQCKMQSANYEVQNCVQVFILHFVICTLHFALNFNSSHRSKILNVCSGVREEQPLAASAWIAAWLASTIRPTLIAVGTEARFDGVLFLWNRHRERHL